MHFQRKHVRANTYPNLQSQNLEFKHSDSLLAPQLLQRKLHLCSSWRLDSAQYRRPMLDDFAVEFSFGLSQKHYRSLLPSTFGSS